MGSDGRCGGRGCGRRAAAAGQVLEVRFAHHHPLLLPRSNRLKVGYEQLEPGDRLLMYSDGITEARNAHGEFFGEQRLVDFTDEPNLPHYLHRKRCAGSPPPFSPARADASRTGPPSPGRLVDRCEPEPFPHPP